MFINVAHLYLRMKMTDEVATTQVAWVLSYVQGGIAEAWKDNLLDYHKLHSVISLPIL